MPRKAPALFAVDSNEIGIMSQLNVKKSSKKQLIQLPDNELSTVVTTLYDMMKERRVLSKASQSRTDRLLQEYLKVEKILKNADSPPEPNHVLHAVVAYYQEQPSPTEFEIGNEEKHGMTGGYLDSPSQAFVNYDLLLVKTNEIRKAVAESTKNKRIDELLADVSIKSFLERLLRALMVEWKIPEDEQLRMLTLSFASYMDWTKSVEFMNLPLLVKRHCDPEFMLREFYRTNKEPVKKPRIISKTWMNAVAKRINGE
jgi:hypothetical protein